MSKHYIVAFGSISMIFSLMCMDNELPFPLDLSSAKLPVFAQRDILDFNKPAEAFTTLTKDRALILKSFIAKEQAGEYCSELSSAEKLLRKIIVVTPGQTKHYFRNGFVDDKLIYDEKTTTFLFRVAEKPMLRKCLIRSLHEDDSVKFCEQLENEYVSNSYGSCEPYKGRIITPLHHVLCLGAQILINREMALYYTQALLQMNANPNARDDFDNTPMHHASTPGLVALLLQYGAKYDEYGYENRTPLHNHIRMRNWPVVRCLLKLPVLVNVLDNYRDTPLHEAVRQYAPMDIIKSLIAKGARYHYKNNKSETPFNMMRQAGLLGIIASHIKCKLCDAIANDNAEEVIDTCRRYFFDYADILNWAQKFYPNNRTTQILKDYENVCTDCFLNHYLPI